MATENKKLNGRLQLKHDTEANWIKAVNFIPLAGEIIIYDADDVNPVRVKIGDGATKVNDLPFYNEKVQGDWNQNNESADDYIKNRTHWVEDQLIEIYPETTRGESEFAEPVFDEIFEGTYVVTFDGVQYKCTAVDGAIGDSRLNSLDDLSSAIDVPFYMYCYEGFHIGGAPDDSPVLESGIFYADGGTHTIKIEKVEGSTYHPLDEGFIPDTIARKSDIGDIDLTNYYTKTEIDNLELITVEDIDTICGATIQLASEVEF